MADTAFHTPFMGSVTATGTAQSLYTLLLAKFTQLPIRACFVSIQLDTSAGATSLYIGNSAVLSTNAGVNLSANQAQQTYAFDSNLIALNDLWLLSAGGSIQVNIVVVVR